MAKIAMISQPMRGKTDEEIKNEKELAEKILKEKGYEILNTLFEDDWSSKDNLTARGIKQIPVYFLARSLRSMSRCDAVYFVRDGMRLEAASSKNRRQRHTD